MNVYTALVVALLMPAAAFAQAAPGHRAPVQSSGEEVIVTQSASGDELRGRLVELSPTTLAMLVNGQRVELPLESVLRIDARTDSLKNGMVIGATVMGGLAAVGCLSYGPSAPCVTGVILNTGFGALMGAGIDALHKGRSTIYSKPASVTVAPAGHGARVQLKLKF